MTEDGQSVFTFDLNESVWFKKGQEVDEMMGISLEPEISIQEMGDFVSVRGVIELKGEYFQVSKHGNFEEDSDPFHDHPSYRLVDRIETYEDGVNEFFHHFPVEVSIPKYRVHSLEDVMVGIESFDYELPESNQLKLNASLAIHGVVEPREKPEQGFASMDEEEDTSEQQEERTPSLAEEELANGDTAMEKQEEVFRFDVKEKAEEETEVESPESADADTEKEIAPELNTEVSEQQPDKDRWKKKTQSLAEFFGKLDGEEKLEETEGEEEVYYSETEESYESPDELEKDREDAQDTRYLLNIFENKEERFTSMKMCIVQESDTLASLAEKYKISPLHISKSNRLGDEDITEGQILYIPAKK
ncbi:stage VI sporulation protein D [Sediminibacillus albus]|uniref:stage VI sporulation protein D n=1 Tax=Sediminibacillus albus TaxID=407036 RepID=UPI0015881DBD|nr:stage VI sporulation protein D [Sediminibacillus albus]